MSFSFKNNWRLIVVLIFVVFTISPWFKTGLPATDDFRHHLTKIWFLDYSWENYHTFFEWVPYIYSGWPLTHFYHSLPYYFAAPLTIFFTPITILKILIISSIIVAGFGMFYSTRKLFNSNIALISSIIYLLIPIHFEFAYISGSISRLVAYAILPLVIVLTYLLINEPSKTRAVTTSILWALLLLANLNIAYCLFLIFLVYLIYKAIIWKKIEKKLLKNLALSIILTITLVAFWLFPMYIEGKESSATTFTPSIFGSQPKLYPLGSFFQRGFGVDANIRYFYIGYVLLITTIVTLLFFKFKQKKDFLFFIIISTIPILFSFIYNYIPYSSMLAFNIFFGLILSIFLCWIAALGIYSFQKFGTGWIKIIGIILFALIIIDFYPGVNSYIWIKDNDLGNPPTLIAAYDFVKSQPGYFRVYSPFEQLPYMYHEKFEIGTRWMGFREGALKPIRQITDDIQKSVSSGLDNNALSLLGFMSTKYFVFPCVETNLKQLYSNQQFCVYENPYYTEIITYPKKIYRTKNVDPLKEGIDPTSAILLEDCKNDCIINNTQGEIKNIIIKPESIEFTAISKENSYVLIKSAYFKPHWNAYIDDKEVEIKEVWPKYMLINVPGGQHNVKILYKTNKLHIISSIISILAVLLCIFLLFYKKEEKNISKKIKKRRSNKKEKNL